MKTKNVIAILSVLLISSTAIFAQKKNNVKTSLFDVNLHCHSCQQKVEKNIAYEKGVKDLKVNLNERTVAVTYDSRKNSDEGLIKAFEKLGFTAAVSAGGEKCSKHEHEHKHEHKKGEKCHQATKKDCVKANKE